MIRGATPTAGSNSANAIPDEFANRCNQSDVCAAFAYHGKCRRETDADGKACKHPKSNRPFKHVCLHCQFAQGTHDIKAGACTR